MRVRTKGTVSLVHAHVPFFFYLYYTLVYRESTVLHVLKLWTNPEGWPYVYLPRRYILGAGAGCHRQCEQQ